MKLRFNYVVIITLLALSAVFFGLQMLIFADIKNTLFYILQDLMFLPLNILLVTFMLNKVLESREKREKLEQLNIVIGAFFSEAGTGAIEELNPYMSGFDEIRRMLEMNKDWNDAAFEEAAIKSKAHDQKAVIGTTTLEKLKVSLPPKKAYLLQMFSNPNLLEHDTFTEMLWALYHLIDELENREDVSSLPGTDIEHISGDIVRSYRLLVYEWVLYMKYLKKKYPYLWSLAVRKNPFAKNSVIIG